MYEPVFYSSKPMDYIHVALAIETLAYQNKNYLSRDLQNDSDISKEIQALLFKAIELTTEDK